MLEVSPPHWGPQGPMPGGGESTRLHLPPLRPQICALWVIETPRMRCQTQESRGGSHLRRGHQMPQVTQRQHGKPLPVFSLGRHPKASQRSSLRNPQPRASSVLLSAPRLHADLVGSVPGGCLLHWALHPQNTAWILGLSSSLSSETAGHFVRTVGGHFGMCREPHCQSHWTLVVQGRSGYKRP